MSLASPLGPIHVVAAVVALLTAWHVVRAARGAAYDVRATRWLLVTLGSVAVWSGHLAWWYLFGASSAQILWLPSVGATIAGLLAWTVTVLRPDQASTRVWVALWLLDPVLLVGAHFVLGPDAVVVRDDTHVVYGWFYGVHVLLVFAMMLATASMWSGFRADTSRTIRILGRVIIVGLLAAGAAQGLQLMVLDLIMAVTGAVAVALVVRAGPDALRPSPAGRDILYDARTPATPAESAAAASFAHEIEQLAAATDLETLVALGVRFASPEDSVRAAHALTFVVGDSAPLVIGVIDESSFVAVTPSRAEADLLDVAAAWQSPATEVEYDPDDDTPRTISLAPVLAGEGVVLHGPADQATALVAAVRSELVG